MTIPPSSRPVYLKGPKGKGEAELWVRVGNSTRRLEVADAVQYVAARWPESVRVSPLTRARLFFTLRRHRDTPPACRASSSASSRSARSTVVGRLRGSRRG